MKLVSWFHVSIVPEILSSFTWFIPTSYSWGYILDEQKNTLWSIENCQHFESLFTTREKSKEGKNSLYYYYCSSSSILWYRMYWKCFWQEFWHISVNIGILFLAHLYKGPNHLHLLKVDHRYLFYYFFPFSINSLLFEDIEKKNLNHPQKPIIIYSRKLFKFFATELREISPKPGFIFIVQ